MLLGCIADDLTGATDLALMLVRGGMRTVQVIGVPGPNDVLPEADAVVVALKSRTIPAAQAVAQSLAAADALRSGGARQLFFKYCSTFDSTDAGNIGPVAEELLQRCGGDLTIACPAFPATGRTVYRGYLFVGDVLLSESPLRDHPLTPMRDPSLVRVLQRQTRLPVGLLGYETVVQGTAAIRDGFDRARQNGNRILIVDALSDQQLHAIGEACADLSMVTGGSGVAMGLPDNFRRAGLLPQSAAAAEFVAPEGPGAILAGSCSAATRAQVEHAIAAGMPGLRLDPVTLAADSSALGDAEQWAQARLSGERPLLIYSTAEPDAVAAAQRQLGRDQAGDLIERALAQLARMLVAAGVRRLIVAGGETSGAVVGALGAKVLQIGPEIAPGVPWTLALHEPQLALALKSGNFGGPDFFTRAWELLK